MRLALFFILLLLPVAGAFSGQSANYKINLATLGTGYFEGESTSYNLRSSMTILPTGSFSKLYLGYWYFGADRDYDGHNALVDCNDNNALVHPDAQENCLTRYDDNCNGVANEGCYKPRDREIHMHSEAVLE